MTHEQKYFLNELKNYHTKENASKFLIKTKPSLTPREQQDAVVKEYQQLYVNVQDKNKNKQK